MATSAKARLREKFETERRRAAFFGFLPGMGVGIIVGDTWINGWAGLPGGLLVGGAAYLLVYGYETRMWRREHG